jgi:hypothetical protein
MSRLLCAGVKVGESWVAIMDRSLVTVGADQAYRLFFMSFIIFITILFSNLVFGAQPSILCLPLCGQIKRVH